MRVTNNMLVGNMVYNLNQNLKTLEKLQNQKATGKKFRVPSDNPIGTSKSLKFNTDISKLKQYERNATDAMAWMKDTDSALDEIGEVLKRAYELTVDAANDTKGKDDLKNIEEEISQLREHLIQLGNTTHAERHIFSGHKTDKPLIHVKDGEYEDGKKYFAGQYAIDLEDKEIFEYNVGISEKVKVNTLGTKVFGKPEDYPEDSIIKGEKPELIKVFDDLSKALGKLDPDDDENSPNREEVRKSITKLQDGLNDILSVRAEVGAKMNRLEMTEKKLKIQVNNVKELLSYNEDVDMAEISMEINMAENVYISSLMTGAKIIQPTLMEFLR